jgi:hypothetical protein
VSALLCLLSALGTRFISEPDHLRRPSPATTPSGSTVA